MTDLGQLFIDLVRAETRLYNAIDDRLRAEQGMSVGQYQLLLIISERDDCRVYDIVQEIAITVGAASKAVDRLEAAGWCRRSANPDDRRSSLLTLTAAGTRKLKAARPTFERELADRFDGVISARASEQLARALSALRSALEDHQRS